tara:strand:- start:97 stop:786 length:690 start_codon:yes stop_codon:yes gene_type:complete
MKKKNNFLLGMFDVMPLLLPVIPFGIIFGAISIELGFSPLMTFATSIIIFSGASQIVFFQLLSGGASSLIAITSSSVISTRHLLYGAVVAQYLSKLSLAWKITLSYLLTDQAFAVSQDFFKKNLNDEKRHFYLLGSGLTLWIVWQITTIIGIMLGSVVPDELGLTFTIPLTFIALLINYFRKIDHLFVIFLSGFLSIIFYNAPYKSYIILSSLCSLLAIYIFYKLKNSK